MQVDWTSTPANALTVQVSTDGGRDFCEVSLGAPLSDFLHVAGAQQLCLFPTVSLKLSVQWKTNAVLTSLSVTFLAKHPQEFAKPPVKVGGREPPLSEVPGFWLHVILSGVHTGRHVCFSRHSILTFSVLFEVDTVDGCSANLSSHKAACSPSCKHAASVLLLPFRWA